MKTSLNFFTGLALTTSLVLTTTACDKLQDVQPIDPTGSARVGGGIDDIGNAGFQVETFADKIEARLNGKVPGYAYRIWVNGQPYTKRACAWGKARYPVDAPAMDYAVTTRQGVGSCTKLVTALTVLRILERNEGVGLNSPVWPYLPAYFKPHGDFKKIRFVDLLSHTAGIIQFGKRSPRGQLNDVQDSVEGGIRENELDNNEKVYSNMSFGICRVLVPYMLMKLEGKNKAQLETAEANGYDALNKAVASIFRDAVRNEVMKPAGVATWSQVDAQPWGAPADKLLKFYPDNNTTVKGVDDDSNFLDAGAGGLYLNASELAQVVAAARQGKIVTESTYQKMKAGEPAATGGYQLGFDNEFTGQHGVYHHKNGNNALTSTSLIDFGGPSSDKKAVNVQFAITCNTDGTDASKPGVWIKLFDESWK